MKSYRIAVAGTGYVGLSLATLLSQHNHVTAVDVIPEKVDLINNRKSPIQDDCIEKYLAEKSLDLTATLDGRKAYADAEYVIIAAPTNYDPVMNYFDTSHVEEVIELILEVNPNAVMVIKSTIPVGYCRSLYVKYWKRGLKKLNLIFAPEFLRESKALYDNLGPLRQPLSEPHHRGHTEDNRTSGVRGGERGHRRLGRHTFPGEGRAYIRGTASGRCCEAGHPHAVHGSEGG